MSETKRVRMLVSIASARWSFQPQQVVEIDAKQARQWIGVGHAVEVSPDTPLTFGSDVLADLSAEEALRHRCSSCDRARGQYVLENRAYCARCYRAHLGIGG